MKKFLIILLSIFIVSFASCETLEKTLSSPKIETLIFRWCNPATEGWQDGWYYHIQEYKEINSECVPFSAKQEVFKKTVCMEEYYCLFIDPKTKEWYLAESHFLNNYNSIDITWKKVKVRGREN